MLSYYPGKPIPDRVPWCFSYYRVVTFIQSRDRHGVCKTWNWTLAHIELCCTIHSGLGGHSKDNRSIKKEIDCPKRSVWVFQSSCLSHLSERCHHPIKEAPRYPTPRALLAPSLLYNLERTRSHGKMTQRSRCYGKIVLARSVTDGLHCLADVCSSRLCITWKGT